MVREMSEDVYQRIEQLICHGEQLAREVEGLREQMRAVASDMAEDILTVAAGEIAAGIAGNQGRRYARKYVKGILASQRREQAKETEQAIKAKVETWIRSIEEFLNGVSTVTRSFTTDANSRQLVRRLRKVNRYVKPETKIRHTIAFLHELIGHQLVYNEDIPKLLTHREAERPSEAYDVLYALETELREFIQKQLKAISSNWWRERVPQDVRENAEKRKQRNEKQWPWYGGKDKPLICYVDFADYAKIITRRNNWKDVFQQFFKDKETISVKLRELEPIRNAIAHSREVGPRDLQKLRLYAGEILACIRNASRAL